MSIQLDYATSFVMNFYTLSEDVVRGTIWHPLWKYTKLSPVDLARKLYEVAQKNPQATLYTKYTERVVDSTSAVAVGETS